LLRRPRQQQQTQQVPGCRVSAKGCSPQHSNAKFSVNPCKGGGAICRLFKRLAESAAWPKGEGAGTGNNRDGTENRGFGCNMATQARSSATRRSTGQAILALMECIVLYQFPVTRTTSHRLYFEIFAQASLCEPGRMARVCVSPFKTLCPQARRTLSDEALLLPHAAPAPVVFRFTPERCSPP
jgi:hypothetical protein